MLSLFRCTHARRFRLGVDAAFFADTSTRSNFLCCLGRGDPDGLFPRNPRFTFDEVCRIV